VLLQVASRASLVFHAEDLRRSAIFIKYTVGSFNRESVQSLNRDDVAICREIGGRDWIVTAD
jgi:hypothetical protein